MKVAFDNQIFNLQAYGGISRYYVELAKQLSTMEQNIKVFAGLHKNEYLSQLSDLMVYGKKVKYPPKLNGLFLYLNQITMGLTAIKSWQPEIIHHTYYYDSPFNYVSDARNIITVYDMIHELYPEQFKTDRLAVNKRKAVQRADHIFCISESTKKDLIDVLDVCEDKITVTYLGFYKKTRVTLKDSQYSGLSEGITKPYILFVGQREGYKNFNSLLKAYKYSKKLNNELMIVAFGGGHFSSTEKQLIIDLGLNEKDVIQVGGGDEILSQLYSQAKVFVYPSLYEGFGIPPLEAMSHLCPVACSNTSSIPEVVGNAALTFSPLDIEAMTETIEKIVFDSQISSQLTTNGLKQIQYFSWENCAAKTLKQYKSIIK